MWVRSMKTTRKVCISVLSNAYFRQRFILWVIIGEREGIGITQLAEILQISKPTLSERIRILCRKGFVRKEVNPVDRKAVTLWLTEDGKIACVYHEKHHQHMFQVFKDYFKDDTEVKLKLFSDTFNQLLRFEQHFINNNR